MKEWEMLEWNTFVRWFKDYPNLRHPSIAITNSLARKIALVVYEELKKEVDKK